MTRHLTLGGLTFSPLVVAFALALLATMAMSATLARLGAYRHLWHRPLVEVSILCVLVAAFDTALGLGSSA